MDVQSLPIFCTPTPPITKMFSATENLQLLNTDLGDQAHLLQHPPIHRLITVPFENDPEAVSFKLEFGAIRAKKVGKTMGSSPETSSSEQEPIVENKQSIWVHLYPATKPGERVEIKFHAYDSNGTHIARHDGENIGKVVTGCTTAFALPTKCRWSRSKLVALAKYYFLRKLADAGTEDDKKRLQFGIPITRAFKDDLKTVCHEFEERASRLNANILRVTAGKQASSQDSSLSEAPAGLLEKYESDSEKAFAVKQSPVAPTRNVAQRSHQTVSTVTKYDDPQVLTMPARKHSNHCKSSD